MNLLWEISFGEFILVTCILGGGAAWMTGRAMASTWKPYWQMVMYMVLLGLAVRFIHFSLFSGTFFLPPAGFATAAYYYVVDFVVLLAIALTGHRYTRAKQMSTQYSFLYLRSGPLAWRDRSGGTV